MLPCLPIHRRTAYIPNKTSRIKKVKALTELEGLGIITPGRLEKFEKSVKASKKHKKNKDERLAAVEAKRAVYDIWDDADAGWSYLAYLKMVDSLHENGLLINIIVLTLGNEKCDLLNGNKSHVGRFSIFIHQHYLLAT